MFRIRHRRRGANAAEFALVMPFLVMLVLGTIDFGWYFLNETLVTNALTSAVKSGSTLRPDPGDNNGMCSPCIASARDHAVESLQALGISVDPADVTPTIESLSGTCALVMRPTIDHTPLVGFVQVSDAYGVSVAMLAQYAEGC